MQPMHLIVTKRTYVLDYIRHTQIRIMKKIVTVAAKLVKRTTNNKEFDKENTKKLIKSKALYEKNKKRNHVIVRMYKVKMLK